ncbi:D-arabinose 1-dehydrogenase (NAD(P)(+)) ARA2 [Aspergillus homomorphus CBS 101889]|uniref:Putative L-galactose dehydrogenase (L-GalDH) n=1 Tax=Aspergillus homomorphus (strain CBS 101889) TaxID=1450537 RepID=A0A395I8S4_ASPHC|nr:putative L-galactose dehydrogenase (L-GalDH) [Aspergillus homomorphus CBS 101889]RAL15643.1 putative L-galactose dehydrogenase (L-GalDH) [Aspergillus homomorphus CBS 101889]
MGRPSSPLSAHLPPLIMGTATFNSQYNHDPYALPTTELVHRALTDGVRAFDTSPYYGPAEELLGRALASETVRTVFPRHTYQILTKVGRIASSSFDYSPRWIRHSIRRSLQRLHTDYLDAVYCHDVEFVSRAEALNAVRELRRIRDTEGTIRYVGISGYPVDVLCEVAELVLRETGEPLDIVQSYANFTLQNTKLLSQGLPRLAAAGVDVVPNASPLGMGLLRRKGVPIGSMGDFHPAPDGLRNAVLAAGEWADTQEGEKLEVIAIRFALEAWLRDGAKVGARGPPLACAPNDGRDLVPVATKGAAKRLGVSVMGVSNVDELNETLRVWRSIIDGLENDDDEQQQPSASLTPSEENISDRAWSQDCQRRVSSLAQQIQAILGPEWVDFTWASPGPDFVNTLPPNHLSSLEEAEKGAAKAGLNAESSVSAPVETVDKTALI